MKMQRQAKPGHEHLTESLHVSSCVIKLVLKTLITKQQIFLEVFVLVGEEAGHCVYKYKHRLTYNIVTMLLPAKTGALQSLDQPNNCYFIAIIIAKKKFVLPVFH